MNTLNIARSDMTREEIINEYLKDHRHDVLLNPYAGLLDFAKYLDEHPEFPAGLEEEISSYWNWVTGFQPSFAVLELKKEDLAKVARHFYELGKNAK